MHRFVQQEAQPVVLLLGWLGSKAQHVQKYRQMWESLGALVLLHQPSILQTAAPRLADRAALAVMRDVSYRYSGLCTVRGAAPPVLVHAMSNAGFIAFGTMLHLASLLRQARPAALSPAPGSTAASLEVDPAAYSQHSGGSNRSSWLAARQGGPGGKDGGVHGLLADSASLAALSAFRQVLGNTQGIVLDSAPSQATAHIWSRGLLSALLSQPAQEAAEAHPLLLRALRAAAERYFQAPAVLRRQQEVRHAWQHSVPPCPQLFLYSKADALIPYQHIERFMEQQAARGAPVHRHCWDDTAHCEHLRKHPEQYKSLVRSFMERCLHSQASPESWI